MKLTLLRGPSGTGKSSIARALIEKHNASSEEGVPVWYATDQFFTGLDNIYRFSLGKLKVAHQWCQLETERAMLLQVPLVIVSNTFIAHWEMERYLELAEEYKYEVQIIRTPGPWDIDTLFRRNKHSVPLDVIKRHINGYQSHASETEWTDFSIFK
jgi:predicted kinase